MTDEPKRIIPWTVPYTIEGEWTFWTETADEARVLFQQKDILEHAANYNKLVEHTPINKIKTNYLIDPEEGIDGIAG